MAKDIFPSQKRAYFIIIVFGFYFILFGFTLHAQPTLWGMTPNGGACIGGNIFKIPTGTSNLSSVYDFCSDG